jgi:SAP domain-containing ribonucleoprotein
MLRLLDESRFISFMRHQTAFANFTSLAPAAGDDEIDWDEDEKPTTAPAAAAVAAGGQGQIATPVAVPNQKVDVDPSKTTDLKVTGGEGAPTATDGAVAASGATTTDSASAAVPEVPKQDFSIGIAQTDAEKEAERRAARAKRFGIAENEEETKKLDRAKKFGEASGLVVKGLDDALPERRAKRGREGGEKQGGRGAKRQTPDRRTEAPPAKAAAPVKKPIGKVIDDPAEKAKAEARAKRFATAT